MSEELLKALIQLLAIVATEDDVTADERATIENFLLENLSQSEAEAYMKIFDRVSKELTKKGKKTTEQDHNEIGIICQQMNKELTSRQKTAVMLNLIILIIADGKITDRERDLLYFIGDQINISKNLIDYLKAFVVYTDRSKLISSHILIIDNGTFESPGKSKHIKNANLEGFLFFLRIPDSEIYFLKYLGTQHLTLNGDPLRSNKIYTFSSGSSIRGDVINSVYYSDVVNSFKSEEQTTKLSFLADNLSYKFKNGNIGLRNVQIAESGGRLIGLMGASGSGKSTLLNVLNGNESPTSGSVRINGIDIHTNKKEIEGVIGYVPQDDLLMEDLTVFQNLYYAAKLCFKDYKKNQLVQLVEDTLESLGLTETRNLKVGSPLEKTISGGQRKRLNIGLELLREPSVLYVDEPTSGLSSRDSENIMDLLRDLSLKGKMIFVVIHQPSLDIFKMFDKLIILDVGGYQIYYGNPLEGISYFKDIVNLKDQNAVPNPEQIFNIVEAKVVNEYGHFTKNRKVVPEQWYENFKKHIQIPRVKEITDEPNKTLKIPNKLKQAATFTIRDVLGKLSNRQYLVINFLEAPLLAFLLAFIVRYIPANQDGYIFRLNENLPVYFFMSVIVALFMGLTVSAEEIIKDQKILKRESFLNLSRGSYILSKLIILFILSAIQTLSFVLVGDLILGIKGMTVSYWLVLLSVSFFANVLGLNISSAFKSVVTIYILIPLLIIPQLILSGVVVSFDKLNPSISTQDKVPLIGEIMASRWAYEALAVTQFKDNAYEKQFYEFDKQIATSEYKVVYMLPNLVKKLEYCHLHNGNEGEEVLDKINYNLNLIQNTIRNEIGDDAVNTNYSFVNQLNSDEFSESVYTETDRLLKTIKTFYNNKSNEASDQKEQLTKQLRAETDLLQVKDDYFNDRIAFTLKNTSTAIRMLEEDGELVQKIYPIYMDANPSNSLDFRGQFYQPNKAIFGMTIDTLWFNIIVIWVMTLLLVAALYFDVLRRIVSGKGVA